MESNILNWSYKIVQGLTYDSISLDDYRDSYINFLKNSFYKPHHGPIDKVVEDTENVTKISFKDLTVYVLKTIEGLRGINPNLNTLLITTTQLGIQLLDHSYTKTITTLLGQTLPTLEELTESTYEMFVFLLNRNSYASVENRIVPLSQSVLALNQDPIWYKVVNQTFNQLGEFTCSWNTILSLLHGLINNTSNGITILNIGTRFNLSRCSKLSSSSEDRELYRDLSPAIYVYVLHNATNRQMTVALNLMIHSKSSNLQVFLSHTPAECQTFTINYRVKEVNLLNVFVSSILGRASAPCFNALINWLKAEFEEMHAMLVSNYQSKLGRYPGVKPTEEPVVKKRKIVINEEVLASVRSN